MKIAVGTAGRPSAVRRRWMVENMRTIGAAAGVIMAIIITVHITTSTPTSTQLQACIAGMAIAMPGIVGMSGMAMSDIAEVR
jgi:hypothetical protein